MCDTGYIIRDHLPAILQAIATDLKEMDIDMPLQITRCYCTAVMMTYIIIGRIDDTLDVCNQPVVRTRQKVDDSHSLKAALKFKSDLLGTSKNPRNEHALFYVLITSYNGSDDTGREISFPGHVFVIERVSQSRFNMYQSYVNKYDLRDYMLTAKSLSVGREKMGKWVDKMCDMMSPGRFWDDSVGKFWMEMTQTTPEDLTSFQGMKIDGNIMFCYKVSVIKDCTAALLRFAERHLATIRNLENKDVPYGVHASDMNEYTPITAREMENELVIILSKLR